MRLTTKRYTGNVLGNRTILYLDGDSGYMTS